MAGADGTWAGPVPLVGPRLSRNVPTADEEDGAPMTVSPPQQYVLFRAGPGPSVAGWPGFGRGGKPRGVGGIRVAILIRG